MKAPIFAVILVVGTICSSSVSTTNPYDKMKAPKDFASIPAGKSNYGSVEFEVGQFFISKYEVTNSQYRAFLDYLKSNARTRDYEVAQVQSDKWSEAHTVAEIGDHYFTHSSYDDFPVVNINHESAQLYCQWLTDNAKDKAPEGFEILFRLPSRQEWVRAARADSQYPYAWNTPYLTHPNGNYRCNFRPLGVENIHFNEETQDYEIIQSYQGPDLTLTTKAGDYDANDFGLFNMCGNVAEMLDEEGIAVGGHYNSSGYDVRVESLVRYSGASPFVGFRPVMVVKKIQ